MSALDMIRGRMTATRTLTNKSGGAVAIGDVVVIGDGTNDNAFTTTTTAALSSRMVGVALEAIANDAAGLVAIHGWVPKVNSAAGLTRDHFLFTSTTAKEATGSATRAVGAFGQVLESATDPEAMIWGMPDAVVSPLTTKGDIMAYGTAPDRLAVGTDGQALVADSTQSLGVKWGSAAAALGQDTLGTTTDGGSDETCAVSRWWGKLVTPANTGLLTGIAAYVHGTGGAVEFGIFAAVMDDNSSVPQNVVALNFPGGQNATGLRINATDRWLWVPLLYPVTASTPIWIVFGIVNWDSSNFTIAYAGSGSDYNGLATSVIQDTSVAAPSSTARDYSLQAKVIR